MAQELPICPVCKKGRMRPLPLVADLGDENNRPISKSRDYQCDNDECKHKEADRGLFEYH